MTPLKWSAFVILGTACTLIITFMGYLLFIAMPVILTTEATCLRAGYPKARVSVFLERYCITLEGNVSVRVDALPVVKRVIPEQ